MPAKRRSTTIRLGGQLVDQTGNRLPDNYVPGAVSSIRFPTDRQWATVEDDRVTCSIRAPTVVQLFAVGTLPTIGGDRVSVEVDGVFLGDCVLESVRLDLPSHADENILLHFRRPIPTGQHSIPSTSS